MAKEYFYCPKCKSERITSQRFHHEGKFREVHCVDCEFVWIEQFEIVGNYTLKREELEDPELKSL